MNIFLPSNERLTVSILVLPECSMMSVACTLDPMRAANMISGETRFDWEIMSLDGNSVELTCGLPLAVDTSFPSSDHRDVLIVVAGFNSQIHAGTRVLANLARCARQYSAIGGVEAGGWVLARAGLLDQRRATTHWQDLEDFSERFSGIEVMPDRFVIDRRIFTTGGASPTFDLMLHLIRARLGATVAMEVASTFIYNDANAPAEAQTFASLGRLEMLEPRVANAVRLMEANLDEPIALGTIAARLDLSRRTLENLFQKTLQHTPGAYYRHLRLQQARRLISETGLSLQAIAIRTGFGSSSAFSRAFNSHFGIRPADWRGNKPT